MTTPSDSSQPPAAWLSDADIAQALNALLRQTDPAGSTFALLLDALGALRRRMESTS